MNHGPLIFLSAFFALSASWFGFVLTPHLQVGQLQQTNTVPTGITYPVARPGQAQQGLQVYRANGCAYCHSQQVTQRGTVFDLLLTDVGTNRTQVVTALQQIDLKLTQPEALRLLEGLPKPVLRGVSKETATRASKTLKDQGATAVPWIVALGPDISRGWGKRRSVAEDFLYDTPALPGGQRIGPDLATIGVRHPDVNWHLRHLYAPQAVIKGSTMPPYPYLFEKRKVGEKASPDALQFSAEEAGAVETGYEVVPRPEALALAAYLVSLRAEAPLFNAPVSLASAAPAAPTTNAPATTPSK